jgi:hypothetical protein
VGTLVHRAIKRGFAFNTLLVVLRGGLLEVYVNGVAVCHPVHAGLESTPAMLALGYDVWLRKDRVEFERLTVWSAEGLPTPEARGARAKPPPGSPR